MAATVEVKQVGELGERGATKHGLLSLEDRRIVATVVAIKALVFVFAAQSYQVISDKRIQSPGGWLATLTRWDTVNFLKIAQHGYSADGPDRNLLAFFPLYPWATRMVAWIAGDYLISGLLVSTIASVAAGLLLVRLVRIDFPERIAQQAVWFLFIFPTSYFLHFAYTESLFLAFTLGCILAARKRHWAAAGFLGALACLTRITGLILVPVVLIEALQEYFGAAGGRKERRFELSWLWIALIPVGFIGYLILNLEVTGDPFSFLAIQEEFWNKALAPPWIGINGVINSVWWRSPGQAQIVGMQELIYIALGLVCTIYSWGKLRRSYAVWMTGNWLVFTSTSFVYCVPRYTLTLFPIFILFAQAAEHRLWNSVITGWSLIYLGLFTTLFVCGYWAF